MGARMGHIQEQQRAIYEGKNGPHTRATTGHIWGQQWGMHARIHGHIWGQ